MLGPFPGSLSTDGGFSHLQKWGSQLLRRRFRQPHSTSGNPALLHQAQTAAAPVAPPMYPDRRAVDEIPLSDQRRQFRLFDLGRNVSRDVTLEAHRTGDLPEFQLHCEAERPNPGDPVRKKCGKYPLDILRKHGRAGNFWRYGKLRRQELPGNIEDLRTRPRMDNSGNLIDRPGIIVANPEIHSGFQERCVWATRRSIGGQTSTFSTSLKRSLLSSYKKALLLLQVLALQMPLPHLGS